MEHERVGLQLHAMQARLVVKYEAKHAKMSKLTFFFYLLKNPPKVGMSTFPPLGTKLKLGKYL